MSPYTMGLTAHSPWKFKVPAGFGVHHTMNPDPYKGLFGGKNCRDSPVQTQRDCEFALDDVALVVVGVHAVVPCFNIAIKT